MNLRILKKLSKRAAPMVAQLYAGHGLTHFAKEWNDDGHTRIHGHDRKHWRRNRAAHDDAFPGSFSVKARRAGRSHPFIHMGEPWTAWDGTPMVGWMAGYYEPEWEERTAWEFLEEHTHNAHTDYLPDGEDEDGWIRTRMVVLRNLHNPAAVFRAARELIEAESASEGRSDG